MIVMPSSAGGKSTRAMVTAPGARCTGSTRHTTAASAGLRTTTGSEEVQARGMPR